MTIEPGPSSPVVEQLNHAERALSEGGSPTTARQDAVELLSMLLGETPAMLLAHPDRQLTPAAVRTYGQWIADRRAGSAIPHITGRLAFLGLDLLVTRDTPLPPPCATRLVEVSLALLRLSKAHELLAAELGTGSGAVALALAALEPRLARIYAVDSSPETLRTASANGERYLMNLVITWLEGTGMGAIPEPVDLIVWAAPGSSDESLAIVELAELAQQAPAALRPGGALICGLDAGEGVGATDVLRSAFPAAEVWVDAQPDGVVVVAQAPRSM